MPMQHKEIAQDQVTLTDDHAPGQQHTRVPTPAYYRDGHWGQCLELLQHLCQYSENILLVSGQSGLGKSALCEALYQSSNQDIQYCKMSGQACQNIGDVLATIAAGFSLPWPVDDHDQEAKNAWVDQVDKHEQTWALLIDDAKYMPQDVLESLIHLAYPTDERARFHLVLFGPEDLEKSLTKASLKGLSEGRLHVIELEPLCLDEVEGFLNHLWRNAGNRTELPFNQTLIKRIYKLSKGLPSEVARLANHFLQGEKLESPHSRVRLGWKSWLGIAGAVIGVCMLALMLAVMFMDIEFGQKTQTVELPDNPQWIEPTETQALAVEDKLNQLKNIAIQTPSQVAIETSDLNVAKGQINESEVELTALEQATHHLNQTHANQNTSQALSMPSLSDAVRELNVKPATEASGGALSSTPAIEMPIPKNIAESIEQKKEALAEISQQDGMSTKPVTTASAIPKSSSVSSQLTKSSKPSQTVQSKANHTLTWSERFLLKRPPGNYALQLLGSSSESSMKKFIELNKLKGKAFYYRTTRQQKPWFVLIYGNYTSRESAIQAIQALPTTVQAQKPWPRTFASVHRSIEEGR